MPKPQPKKYRTTHWLDYNQSLRQRGSTLIWIDKDMDWLAPGSGKRGRAEKFSDAAIQFCLMFKNLFGLAMRQATGMIASLLKRSGLDWSIRRQQHLQACISIVPIPMACVCWSATRVGVNEKPRNMALNTVSSGARFTWGLMPKPWKFG